jgi:hypothetical protein
VLFDWENKRKGCTLCSGAEPKGGTQGPGPTDAVTPPHECLNHFVNFSI